MKLETTPHKKKPQNPKIRLLIDRFSVSFLEERSKITPLNNIEEKIKNKTNPHSKR